MVDEVVVEPSEDSLPGTLVDEVVVEPSEDSLPGTLVDEVVVEPSEDSLPGTDTLTGGEGNDTLEDAGDDKLTDDKKPPWMSLEDWLKLLLTLSGGGAAASGNKGGAPLPPGFAAAGTPGSLSDIFRAKLPAPSGPFADLSARNVSMTPEEWKTYGQRSEQSFFNNVPQRPSGIDNSKRAPVNPGPVEAEPGFAVANAPTMRAGNAGLGWGVSQGRDGLYYSNQIDTEIPLGTREQAEAWVAARNKEQDERLAQRDAWAKTSAVLDKADPSQVVAHGGKFYAKAGETGNGRLFWRDYATEADAQAAASARAPRANPSVEPRDPTVAANPLGVASSTSAPAGASAQPVPGFNPNAGPPPTYNITTDADMNRRPVNPSPFAVGVDALRDRRALPLPAPSAEPGRFAKGGFAVRGMGSGREDNIPARLSDGEYVIDAETVALLGDGSSDSGAKRLDAFRANIRKHKGKKLVRGEFSVNAKKPEAYLKGGRA